MAVNIAIIKLDEISKVLSVIDVGDEISADTADFLQTSLNDISSLGCWDQKCDLKLGEIIKEYTALLNDYYNVKYEAFDKAEDLYALDKKYDVSIPVRLTDYNAIDIFLNLHLLQAKHGDQKFHRIAKRNISNVIGRFLVLFYGSFNTNTSPFTDFFALALECLMAYDWGVDETVLLKLASLNLLDSLGPNSQDQMKRALTVACENHTINEHACDTILQSCDKYYQYHATGKIIEPLDTSWLYAYIYKQRFGFLYCKKITRASSISFYSYTLRMTSICFKNLTERVTGNGPKVVLFEKGIVKRSSEYKPLESSFLFNYTSMKFE